MLSEDERLTRYQAPNDVCVIAVNRPEVCQAKRLNPFPTQNPQDWRKPSVSKKTSFTILVDPADNRIKVAQSNLELNTFWCLRADPAVLKIADQTAPFHWADEDGVAHSHTPDWTVGIADGTSKHLNCKRSERAGEALEATVQQMADQLSPDAVTEIVIVTEEDMPRWHVRNSQLLTNVQRLGPSNIEGELIAFIETIDEPMQISELCDRFGGGEVAFRQIALQIYRGRLKRVGVGLIEPATFVVRADRVNGGSDD